MTNSLLYFINSYPNGPTNIAFENETSFTVYSWSCQLNDIIFHTHVSLPEGRHLGNWFAYICQRFSGPHPLLSKKMKPIELQTTLPDVWIIGKSLNKQRPTNFLHMDMDIAWVHLISGRTACSLSQLVVCSGVLQRHLKVCFELSSETFHHRHPDLFCQGSAFCKSDCDGSPNSFSPTGSERRTLSYIDWLAIETNMLHVWICCLAYWLDFVGLCGKLPGNCSWMFIPPNMVQVMCYIINKPSQ